MVTGVQTCALPISYQLRRLEFLKNTNNDIDMAIIGIPGRATILREVAKGLKMNEDIVPSKDEIDMKFNAPQVQPPGDPAMMQQGVQPAIQRPGPAGKEAGPGGAPPGEQVRMAA